MTQDKAVAPDKIADHIQKFWDPRMRREMHKPERNSATSFIRFLERTARSRKE